MVSIALITCFIITAVLIVLGIKASKDEQKIEDRITSLSRSSEPKKGNLIRKKELDKSFNDRVLLPFAALVFDKTQEFIPLGNKSWVRAKLIQAGYQKPQYQKYFLGIQLLCTVLFFGFILTVTSLFGKIGAGTGIMIAAVFGAAGYGMPLLWLHTEAKKRQTSIQKALADFLDLLVICVEAGLGLDTAINKIAHMKSIRMSTYLREELLIYTKDVGFGRPRKAALLDLAARTGVEDLNAIINAIVNAYEMGTGVAHTLRVQSDSLRVKRLAKAEEKANKIPVKMVPPIYVFLFPAIFVSIFGPIGMQMVEAVLKIVNNMQFGA